MASYSTPRQSFKDYCDYVIANINFAFRNSNSPCNKFYSGLGIITINCAQCSFDLNTRESVAAIKLVTALKDFMHSQADLLDLMFSENDPMASTGFSMVRRNKAYFDEMKAAACEALFLSFDAQLMGRKNLYGWLNDLPEDLMKLKYMDEWDVLKNMAMQPAIKKLDYFLNLDAIT